jgi:hypothetical protein
MSGSYHVNLKFCGTVVHEKKIYKWPHPIFALLWLSPFEEDLVLHLNTLEFPSCNVLYQVWLNFARCFILKDSFVYTKCKNRFPSCGPSRPQRTIICTTLNPHYVRKLSCKSELFWLSGSREEMFSISPPYLHFCDYFPLEMNQVLRLDIFYSLHPRMISTKFDWNWPAGSEEEGFFSI